MTTSVANSSSKFDTSHRQVGMAAAILAVCVFFLVVVIDTSLVQETLGLARAFDARVPTFFIRMAFLLVALAAGLYLVTGLEYYKRNKLAVTPWLFLAVGLAFFLLYVIVPIFQSISYSFTKWDGLYDINGDWTGQWVGLHNYKLLMSDPKFFTSLKNNILWLVLYMLAVPIGLFIALFLNQAVRGIRIYKSLFFFPFVISQVVVGLIFAWAYNPQFGLLSEIWSWFYCETKVNIVGNLTRACSVEPPSILGNEHTATYGIIAAGLWPQIAYCMILYLTGMLWHVVLPQLKPATFIAIVVTVIGALRSFDMVATMTQGGPFGSTSVLAYYMYDQAVGEGVGRYGYGSAIATVLFLIMLLYISYFLYRMYQDEKEGN